MYAYRHKIVIKGKLETGVAETKNALKDKSEYNNSNEKTDSVLQQVEAEPNIVEQLRILHSAVMRTKQKSLNALIS